VNKGVVESDVQYKEVRFYQIFIRAPIDSVIF